MHIGALGRAKPLRRTRFFWVHTFYLVRKKKSLDLQIFSRISKTIPYNLVLLFNVGPGCFLCNVGKTCTMFARHLQQPVIVKTLTGSKYKSSKSDVIQTLHWIFPYAMLSGVSWAALYRIFTSAMLSQEYYDNVQQDFSMCNVV